jgi:hypothetical protein
MTRVARLPAATTASLMVPNPLVQWMMPSTEWIGQDLPSLLPILRSQQQAELLALLLGDPELELSVTDLAERTGIPYATAHREVERAEVTGLFTSRKVGRTRLIRADTTSPSSRGWPT